MRRASGASTAPKAPKDKAKKVSLKGSARVRVPPISSKIAGNGKIADKSTREAEGSATERSTGFKSSREAPKSGRRSLAERSQDQNRFDPEEEAKKKKELLGLEIVQTVEIHQASKKRKWQTLLLRKVTPGWFKIVEEMLSRDLSIRQGTQFSKAPKEEEMTVDNLYQLALLCPELPELFMDILRPVVDDRLTTIKSHLAVVMDELRLGGNDRKELLEYIEANRRPLFGNVSRLGIKLARLEEKKEYLKKITQEVDELLDERDRFMGYYGYKSDDLYFQFTGTTKLPIEDFREFGVGYIQEYDDKLKELLEDWELKNQDKFKIDGVRALDTNIIHCAKKLAENPDKAPYEFPIWDRERKKRKAAMLGVQLKAPIGGGQRKNVNTLVEGGGPKDFLPPGVVKIKHKSYLNLANPDEAPADTGEGKGNVSKKDNGAETSREAEMVDQAEVKPWGDMDTQATQAPEPDDIDESKLVPFRVVVRIRPLHSREKAKGDREVIKPASDGKSVEFSVATASTPGTLTFSECVSGMSQAGFFPISGARPLIEDCLRGKNVTIMAYGQTGSGKTFTMSGPEDNLGANSTDELVDPDGKIPPQVKEIVMKLTEEQELNQGLIPRVIKYLFRRIRYIEKTKEAKEMRVKFQVKTSFVEIYNEKVRDLLAPKPESCQIRQGQNSFFVHEVATIDVATEMELMYMFVSGSFNRKVSSTNMNQESSRSHSILYVWVERSHVDPALGKVRRMSKIMLVDLAGSERLKQIGSAAARNALETAGINQSLFALSNVVSKFADPDKDEHIPYRDSCLTKLLMDALGSQGRALLIACLSPSERYVEEGTCTLTFASKAANVRSVKMGSDEGTSKLRGVVENKMGNRKAEYNRMVVELSKWKSDCMKLKKALELNGVKLPEDLEMM